MLAPSAAVLQLVQRSAQQFAEILEVLDDARIAGVMTGFSAGATAGTGSRVDTYG